MMLPISTAMGQRRAFEPEGRLAGSLTRTALLRMMLVTTFIVAAATAAVFLIVLNERTGVVLDGLRHYNAGRAQENSQLFDDIRRLHQNATADLTANARAGTDAAVEATFDRLFPLRPDGTRRSLPGLFEGTSIGAGEAVRGIGAFIANGRSLNVQDKRLLLAAFHTVRSLGAGFFAKSDNFYFFTPTDRLIMFAPARTDRLLFYREKAPADFTFQGEEFVTISKPQNNPARSMRCTGLQSIIYDRTRTTWTSGCMTPVDVKGEWVGSWGNSLLLDKLVASFSDVKVPGAETFVFSREGRLIMSSRLTRQHSSTTERYLDVDASGDAHLKAVWSAARGKRQGAVLHLREPDAYLSVERITGPGWYSVVVYPGSLVRQTAIQTSSFVLYLGATLLVAQMIALGLIMRRGIVRPLARFTRSADRLAWYVTQRGERPLDTDLPTERRDEIGAMARAFANMAELVVAEQRQLEEKVAARTLELERLAITDELTALGNRRWLMAQLDQEVRRARRSGESLAVAMLDIDHFKRINDDHGHAAGDDVLRALSAVWLREARHTDLLGRTGGEEFALLMPATDESQALIAVERLREATAQTPIRAGECLLAVTVSIGVAVLAEHESEATLLNRADEALYEAKRSGRNRAKLSRHSTELELRTELLGRQTG